MTIKQCPSCGSPEVGDLDCGTCNGDGETWAHGEDYEECVYCQGAGHIEGELMCNECGEVFDDE